MSNSNKVVLTADEIGKCLKRITHEIIERRATTENIVIVGIKSRGDYLAERIAEHLEKILEIQVPTGALDITLYRDDLTTIAEHPIVRPTEMDININDKHVILVDDVLFTGRTIRCALNQIIDYGRPAAIELAVLIDRGHRELPIRADYVGKNIPTSRRELVHVFLHETDGLDEVAIEGGV